MSADRREGAAKRDAAVNEETGHLLTFAACDLSLVPLAGIGTVSVLVTGPLGNIVYQKTNVPLVSGGVSIHPH